MSIRSSLNMLKCLSLATAFITIGGCASMFGDNTRQVSVNSEPSGANVYYRGQLVGQTPTTVNLENVSSPAVLKLEKQGYTAQFATVNTEFQPIGLLNIFFPPGFLIDTFAGNSMRISKDSRDIKVVLQK